MRLEFDFDKIWNLFLYSPSQPLIFNSGAFLLLFIIFLPIFLIIKKYHRPKVLFLVVFSLFFYYKSSGIYFLLLIASTIIDYLLANQIYKSETQLKRKLYLIISLILNLGLLGYFKYTNLFFEIWCMITNNTFEPLAIFLPVGVSFFTFQSLSYTIEIYRNEMQPVKNIFDYAFFVTFFPQLVAGPIVRAKDFLPQVLKKPKVTQEMLGRAVWLFSTGLFKKAVIGDYISINFVDRIFDNPSLYSGIENLMGVYGYALQIYCDFSGYSDMAIAIALFFGYELTLNFRLPYRSINITEFWKRWHISLSSWLRDYLYISLGGNRKGKFRTYINLMITMLLGGLWHGAGINFIIWGGLHGVALVVNKVYSEAVKKSIIPLGISVFLTFHFVCFCWIFFRATDIGKASAVLHQIFYSFSPQVFTQFLQGYPQVALLMLLGYILHFIPDTITNRVRNFIANTHWLVQSVYITVFIFIFLQIKSSSIQPFIYFQF